MANRKRNESRRFQENERILTMALIGDAVLFVLYLLFAGIGVMWLKAVLSIICILLSLAGLASLYLTGEILKHRSIYLSAGFAAVVLCLLVSLLLNYPSPAEILATTPGV